MDLVNEQNKIKLKDYIIIRRQDYTKLHKFKENDRLVLGSDLIELKGIENKLYDTDFKMVFKVKEKNKRVFILEETNNVVSIFNEIKIEQSGLDNRNITLEGKSQKLSVEEIKELRDNTTKSSEILEKLIDNSSTFTEKTEYSQEKYLKKKEKKYFEYVTIEKPTIYILAEMFFRQDLTKLLGMRTDDLSQILFYSNVHCDSKCLLYESGTRGLLIAAFMDRIGANTKGEVIHIHPGNFPQTQSVLAMNFPEEMLNRLTSVNLYSVIRTWYQIYKKSRNEKRKNESDLENFESKKIKLDDNLANQTIDSILLKSLEKNESGDNDEIVENVQNEKQWMINNLKVCKLFENQVDNVVIVAKENPISLLKEFLNFLKPSRALVVFSTNLNILNDTYFYLKKRGDIVNLRYTENFMRNLQVLPERTHPEVNMTCGGYLLTGYKVELERINLS